MHFSFSSYHSQTSESSFIVEFLSQVIVRRSSSWTVTLKNGLSNLSNIYDISFWNCFHLKIYVMASFCHHNFFALKVIFLYYPTIDRCDNRGHVKLFTYCITKEFYCTFKVQFFSRSYQTDIHLYHRRNSVLWHCVILHLQTLSRY